MYAGYGNGEWSVAMKRYRRLLPQNREKEREREKKRKRGENAKNPAESARVGRPEFPGPVLPCGVDGYREGAVTVAWR